jgi:hypothetical protein
MWWRLQPYVVEAATLCGGGCDPVWWRLQPYVEEAATLCGGEAEAVGGGRPVVDLTS